MKYAYFLLLTILFAFQLNSNATGFGGYCPECLVENIDKDLSQLQNVLHEAEWEAPKQPPNVRFATVFDKDGQAICQVDLLKHPDAVPNFAKLDTSEFVQNTQSNNLQPPCSQEYLAKIKEVANNNVVLNGNQNFKKKIKWKAEVGESVTWCLMGAGMGTGAAVVSTIEVEEENDHYSAAQDTVALGALTAGLGSIIGSGSAVLFNAFSSPTGASADDIARFEKRVFNSVNVGIAGACGLTGLILGSLIFH